MPAVQAADESEMNVRTRLDIPAATLEALMEAAAAVLSANSLEETFGRMSRQLRELVPHDDLALYELGSDGRTVSAVYADGPWAAEVKAESSCIDEGITGGALRTGRTRNVPRTDLDPDATPVQGTNEEPEALVCVPLIVESQTIGTLNVYRTGVDVEFSPQEAEVVERFAAMAALAFNSARQRELLIAQARTDGLTGLLNHRAFHERLETELARATRTGCRLSVVLLDLDHFKAVNDTHGHAEGDRVLRGVSDRLAEAVRADDTVARLGGEEFAVIVAGAGSTEGLEAAERMREAVARVAVGGDSLSASAGVASWPSEGETREQLLEAADGALYAAKHAGRDRVRAARGRAAPHRDRKL